MFPSLVALTMPLILLSNLPAVLTTTGPTLNPQYASDNNHGRDVSSSLPLSLTSLFNNRGFGLFPGDADFDGLNSGYPAEYLPPADLTYAGVNFTFPQYRKTGFDNLLAQGQILQPPPGRYFSVHMLAAAETAVATSSVEAMYAGNTSSTAAVLVDPWWAWSTLR